MPLITIDNADAEKKLSIFRRYYMEVFLALMLGAVIYLFEGQKSMEVILRNYLLADRANAIDKVVNSTEAINKNANAINNNTEAIREVKNLLMENRDLLQDINVKK